MLARSCACEARIWSCCEPRRSALSFWLLSARFCHLRRSATPPWDLSCGRLDLETPLARIDIWHHFPQTRDWEIRVWSWSPHHETPQCSELWTRTDGCLDCQFSSASARSALQHLDCLSQILHPYTPFFPIWISMPWFLGLWCAWLLLQNA